MKEKLTKLLEQCACPYTLPCTGECGGCKNVEMYDDQIEHIVNHLLENQVAVLPCKVGDVLYLPIRERVLLYDVVSLRIEQNSIKVVCKSQLNKSLMTISAELIGSTIFRTLKAAEQPFLNQQLLKNEIMIAKGGE